MIPISKPFLPPKKEYDLFLRGIWKRQWLTNLGPLASKLETNLKEYLEVDELLYVSSGTIALQLAIKGLELKGEIITTPFTYVATTSSIIWEGCTPVFVDIDKDTLNLDPKEIQGAITERTVAIMATHVYGNPCDVVAIQEIADKHGLKVIYDGAHAFGVKIYGQSIFNYGDVSACSLHATKVFHTGEGGLVITKDTKLYKNMAYARNFGHDGPEHFFNLGINGKNSEFHAGLGLANLKYVDRILERYRLLTQRYDTNLRKFKAVKPKVLPEAVLNYAYYTLVFEDREHLKRCIEVLRGNEIFGRRYFYPSLAQSLPYMESKSFPNTDELSSRVYCLPLFYDLSFEEVDMICRLLLNTK